MGNKVAVAPPSDGQADGDRDHVAKERDTGDESATTQPASSKLYGSILMIFGRNIQKSLE